jgi:hypothetical protein
MKGNRRVVTSWFPFALGGLLLCTSSLISGCHKTPAEPQALAAEETEGVTLKPEEVQRMGIVTTEAKTTMHAPEATGFAVVLAHESVATAVAELDTAVATERQSRGALERTRRLAGTAGAMPSDTMEGLERQAVVDQVALELSRRKLSALFGQNAPWKNQPDNRQLRALADGDARLVRISFPLGALGDATPRSLRLARINAAQDGKSIETRLIWSAPADANVPGHSFFAYLKSSPFGEGEHLLAWVPVGEPETGVFVPQSAALINAGKYWCYVEENPGQFVRVELDPNATIADGFFIKEGIEPGAKIVTVAAGQLLAREINPSTAAAD